MFDPKTLNRQNTKGPIIGAVYVHTPFRHHKADYECAAWWEDHEAITGAHPVYIGRSYHSPELLTITAEIKAKVVNDYFPALWGGVAVSREPYKPKHIGEERIIRSSVDIVDAIQRTGNSPGSPGTNHLDWFIHPSWWKVFADEALQELQEDVRRFPEWWSAFANLKEEGFVSRFGKDHRFDDEYRSKVGMVAYYGSLFEKWGRRLEKINWHSQYHIKDGRYDTAYQRDLYAKNTEWTKTVPIQINE